MSLVNISTGDLEAVLAVHRAGSFRSAADELHLTQSAVSARVQHAEEVLGVKLFHRTTRRVSATPHGERLCATAQKMLGDLRSLVKEFKDESHLRRGRVTLGAVHSIACSFVPEVVRSFELKRPGVSVKLRDDFLGSSFDQLTAGKLDFAITTLPEPNAQFDFELLLLDEMLLLAHADHPLAASDSVGLCDICRHPVLMPPGLGMLDRTVLDAFRQEGLELRRDQIRTVMHPLSIVALIRVGLGVCFIPATVVSQLNMQSLRLVRIGEQGLYRRVGIATAHGRASQPAAEALINEFRAAAHRLGMRVSRPPSAGIDRLRTGS